MVTVTVGYIEPEESIIASVPTSLRSISRWTTSNTAEVLSYGYYFSSLFFLPDNVLFPSYRFLNRSLSSLIVDRIEIRKIWKIN